MINGTSRAVRLFRDTRASVVLLVVAGVALVSVIALAYEAHTTRAQQRATEARLRDNIAFIAARTSAARTHDLASNHAQVLLDPLNNLSLRTEQLVSLAAKLSDSLSTCQCTSPLRVVRIRLFDSTGVRLGNENAPPDEPAMAQHIRASMAFEAPRVFFRPPDAVDIVTRLDRRAGAPSVIAVLQSEANNLSTRLLPYVLDSTGIIVPAVLTGFMNNRTAFVLTVLNARDTIFRSGTTPAGGHEMSWHLGIDSTLTFSANIRSELPLPAFGGPANRSWPMLALAMATMFAVIASTSLALRSVQVARMRGDFAAAVSHELRTPLTEIVLFAELLESGRTSDDDGVRDAARVIKTEARRLHHMVENVLHITRVDGNSFPVNIQLQHIRPLMDDILEAFEPIAAQRHCVIRLACSPEMRLAVDASALRQIVLNLLDNAVRYGPDGQQIDLRLSERGDTGVMEVDDAGPGIPEHERQRVWKPYIRLERDVARARTGTGLGLGVVAALVKQMHGHVQLATSSRGGIVVTVSLPATHRT